MEQAIIDAGKYIGAGMACLGMGGAGIGLGSLFGNYLAGAIRNPSAADGQFGRLIFGFAVTEALGIFSLLGLVVNLISDLTYTWIDPRIDFETREA